MAASRSGIQVTDPLRSFHITGRGRLVKENKFPWPMRSPCPKSAKHFARRQLRNRSCLLYVSMTRARDLLVLARSQRKLSGEWLDTPVRRGYFLLDEYNPIWSCPQAIRLTPSSWGLDPVEIEGVLGSGGRGCPLHFKTSEQRTNRLPLVLNPQPRCRQNAWWLSKSGSANASEWPAELIWGLSGVPSMPASRRASQIGPPSVPGGCGLTAERL